MNVRTRRSRLRAVVGASALLTAGALFGLAGPAHAAAPSVDLSVDVSGSKIAAGAEGKLLLANVHNAGPDAATEVTVTYDVSKLDSTKVAVEVPPTCAGDVKTEIVCPVQDGNLAKDDTAKDIFILGHVAKATGAAGSLTVTVAGKEKDAVETNNSKTVDITIVEQNGADLVTWANDVYALADNGDRVGSVVPGDTAPLIYFVFNVGDKAAKGIKITIQLPAHTTFAEKQPNWTYSADNRTATLTDKDVVLDSQLGFKADFSAVTVAPDAPGPVVLTGGTVAIEALSTVDDAGKAAAAAQSLPTGLTPISKTDVGNEIDTADNTDNFAVHVAAPASGGGGGGGLPVTGVQAGLIGGIGGATLITGGVLFMVARRRRVVLVTPGDEKSTV